ncbi:DUF2871 family protein [Sneathia vaginalis]|jgi:hypothetical protein|uniref:DUF2871 family protein n=1 Tax=Sneathia vaginalis TaxID=187101 RepID=UPI00288C0F50|nr:DUF2871 family protein [Sneathia vaginalis]MBE2989315.1 DUF2871 family protein [Sneathia sp. DSM 16630]
MNKKILNLSYLFLILGLVSGVFYREFTKIYAFTGYTTLSVVHTHLLILGTMFLLIISLATKDVKVNISKPLAIYTLGLVIFTISMSINGVFDVILRRPYSNIYLVILSGVGHTLLGVGMVWMMYILKNRGTK